jgi:hypothetical protein
VPVIRYFVVVGSALASLLLILGWSLPEAPANFPDRPDIIERARIRITSERKWPEAVVLDTNQPTFSPMPIKVAPAEQSVEALSDDMTDQMSVDALAKRNPSTRPIDAHRQPARARRRHTRAFRSTHVAKTRTRNEQRTFGSDERCCRFESADGTAISKVASWKRVARRDLEIGWLFPEGKLKVRPLQSASSHTSRPNLGRVRMHGGSLYVPVHVRSGSRNQRSD